MIVTVTANTTLDLTVFVPSFQKNRTMRAFQMVQSMGGKPTDASWILGEIGIPSLALGFAAGLLGQKVERLLQARNVTTDFIPVEGETRMNVVIIDAEDQTHTTITTSTLKVSAEQIEALHHKYEATLDRATCVVAGGTLPIGMDASFYARVIRAARDRNIPVIFDASEPNLRPGLAACPNYIKPNRDELSALMGYPIDSFDMAYQAGRKILAQYGTASIVTFGSDGALAVLPDRAYRIPPLKVDVVSPAGSGDAVLAGLAASIYRQQPIEEGLRLGFAAATAVVLQPGTADCRREDVERFLPQIELIPYADSAH
jgi:1-phosphofructokinase family hexose kinase